MSEHLTAEELILRAAKDTGLTEAIAEALWFIDKHGLADALCGDVLHSLHEDLANAFVDITGATAVFIDRYYGGGVGFEPGTEAEKAEVAKFM
jgi:hypothetical protein